MLRIIRGLPGSGKSSFARYYFPGMFHVENDMGHINEKCEYQFNKDNILCSQMWCHEMVRMTLQYNIECIVSNVFVSKASIDSYVAIAKAYNTEYLVYRMDGHFENNHNVPPEVFQSMKEKFEDYPNEIIIHPENLGYSKFLIKT